MQRLHQFCRYLWLTLELINWCRSLFTMYRRWINVIWYINREGLLNEPRILKLNREQVIKIVSFKSCNQIHPFLEKYTFFIAVTYIYLLLYLFFFSNLFGVVLLHAGSYSTFFFKPKLDIASPTTRNGINTNATYSQLSGLPCCYCACYRLFSYEMNCND